MKLTSTILFASSAAAFVAERSFTPTYKPSSTPCPYIRPDSDRLVPEGYIVRFKPNHKLEDHFKNIGFDVRQFAASFRDIELGNSYSFTLAESNHSMIHDYIRHDPGVLKIEHNEYLPDTHDSVYEAVREPTFLQRLGKIFDGISKRADKYFNGGVRMDFGGEGNEWKKFGPRHYLANSGQGVNVYVFDSGIKTEHDYFRERADGNRIATHFKGEKTSEQAPYCGRGHNLDDKEGHGTHVVGIISNKYGGTAQKANLISVKVQMCGGDIASAEAAMYDVVKEHVYNKHTKPSGFRGSVINMSIAWVKQDGTPAESGGMQDALDMAKREGIPIAAAAGNKARDYLEVSAKLPATFSVGAVDITTQR